MKWFMVAIFTLSLLFVGCPSPVINTVQSSKVIKNSTWQTVTPAIRYAGSRDITGTDLVDYVEKYNETHFDDFLRIYDSEDAPSLEDAPPVSVFIVNPVTYAVNWSMEDVPRSLLVENAAGWRKDAEGQLLFIDHVPPAPIVAPPPSLFAWYAIYEVDNVTGDILLEDHCGYLADDTFAGIPGSGWASVEEYYTSNLNFYSHDGPVLIGQSHIVTRQIYTDPTP